MMKPRVLVLSPMPHHYGGLANNMRLYLSSSLPDSYDLICLNTAARLKREKDPDRPSWITGLYAAAVVPRLLFAILTTRPQLVYMKAGTKWGFLRDIFIILLCKLFKRKLVCHLHSKSSGTLFLDNNALRAIFRWSMRFPDKVIVLSDQLKADFASLIPPDKLRAIDNIVDTSVFDRQPTAKASAKADDSLKILFVGRLSHEKGIDNLFEAIPFVIRRFRKVQFQLAGLALDANGEAEIRAYCLKPPFSQHVVLLGSVQGEAKIRTFLESDIFVLPTLNDNTPNAILEAFAAGLPVVSTNIGQIPHMVEDGINGYIVEAGNSSALAEKLLLLMESPELRHSMSDNNYRKAREKYSVEAGARKMHRVFQELLAPKATDDAKTWPEEIAQSALRNKD